MLPAKESIRDGALEMAGQDWQLGDLRFPSFVMMFNERPFGKYVNTLACFACGAARARRHTWRPPYCSEIHLGDWFHNDGIERSKGSSQDGTGRLHQDRPPFPAGVNCPLILYLTLVVSFRDWKERTEITI